MYKVFIQKVDRFDYQDEDLRVLISSALNYVFGLDYFKPGEKVLIKPNFLMEAEPYEAVTTHPNFVVVLAKILKERGCSVFVGDNPGGLDEKNPVSRIYEALGLYKYKDLFTLLFNDSPPVFKEGFYFSWWADGFDKIVNLPKLKTHNLTVLTSATKNLYGFIPGLSKSEFHRLYPKPDDFSEIILKLYEIFRPRINILDGIVSLEGEGPAKEGIPKKRGLVLISNDALALDFVLSSLINLDYRKVPYLKIALKRTLINPSLIEVFPRNWEVFKIKDFLFPSASILNSIPDFFLKIIGKFIYIRPYIDTQICQECGRCQKNCPSQAIRKRKKGGLEIDYSQCIKCMCCSESCSYSAVIIRRNLILRILRKVFKK